MGCNIQIDSRHNKIAGSSRARTWRSTTAALRPGRYSFPYFQRDQTSARRASAATGRCGGQLPGGGRRSRGPVAASGEQHRRMGLTGSHQRRAFLFQRLFRETLKSPTSTIASRDPRHRSGGHRSADRDIEHCDHVVVLGGQEVIDAAPVLHLRLHKSSGTGSPCTGSLT